jgi:tetratricopeptide (TPR) repeat protein
MANDTTRLTLYALISSIEEDLRSILIKFIEPIVPVDKIFAPKILEKITIRINSQKITGSSFTASELTDYLDFDEATQTIQAHENQLPESLVHFLSTHAKRLHELPPIRNRVMHSRPLELEDFATCIDVASLLTSPSEEYFPKTKVITQKLKDSPEFVFGLSIPVPGQEKVCHNLPVPDFDETGFIGRRTDEDKLVKLLLGAHPVISVVAEGGMGKSALALKAAYSILDKENCPFDAIIWTTAKTSQLTATEIRDIRGAISDSVGLMGVAAKVLGGEGQDPMDDIIGYMDIFKILLIIDNLETVTDGKLKGFLDRLPPNNKVLFTSRIGLGEFERRLILEPLGESDSVRLLNSLARSRRVDALRNRGTDALTTYCRKMRNNPGFVKWFVAAVQAGKRPEDVLNNTSIFLKYCLSNVFGYLEVDSRSILEVLQAVPRPLGLPELQAISGLHVDSLQRGLYQLSSTNMTKMENFGASATAETRFSLSEIARDYLNKHHPISPALAAKYRGAFNRLSSNKEFTDNETKVNRFSFFSIVRRNRSEAIVSNNLTEALRCIGQKDLNKAFNILENARALSPNFFEVHRILAWAYVNSQDYHQADLCYQTAIELEPNIAPLRLWYGSFLARFLRDNERALAQLHIAEGLEPEEHAIKLERARSLMFLYEFDKAREVITSMIGKGVVPAHVIRKTKDLSLQIDLRAASQAYHQKDHERERVFMKDFVFNLKTVKNQDVDKKLCETLRRGFEQIERSMTTAADGATIATMEQLTADFRKELMRLGLNSFADEIGASESGIIKRVIDDVYGFIRSDSGADYHFLVSSIRGFYLSPSSLTGRTIRFYKGKNRMGICAVKVILQAAGGVDEEDFDDLED